MKKNIFTAILLIITVLNFSCSSASDELPGANIEKISNPNVNLELEDITSLGFKKNKTYKVKDLPEAKSAYYGFLKIPKTKESIDYELRFYENQENIMILARFDQKFVSEAHICHKLFFNFLQLFQIQLGL